MSDQEKEKEFLREVIARTEPKIRGSAVFLSLFSEQMQKEPVPILQLGLAVLLDKPIAIIAFDDEVVPENLRKLAFFVARAKRGDMESVEAATRAIIERMSAKEGGIQ